MAVMLEPVLIFHGSPLPENMSSGILNGLTSSTVPPTKTVNDVAPSNSVIAPTLVVAGITRDRFNEIAALAAWRLDHSRFLTGRDDLILRRVWLCDCHLIISLS